MSAIADRGHRVREHTADEVVEAWGPTRERCLEQAVLGFVGSFADTAGAGWGRHLALTLTGTDEQLLIDLLDEVIFHLDVEGDVPVRVRVEPHRQGVLAHLWMTDRGQVGEVGATPKGISRSDLRFGPREGGQWRCSVMVDL
jgi:SHS2 domain-containing protein